MRARLQTKHWAVKHLRTELGPVIERWTSPVDFMIDLRTSLKVPHIYHAKLPDHRRFGEEPVSNTETSAVD